MVDNSKQAAAAQAGEQHAVQAFIDDLQATPSGDHILFGMVKPADSAAGLMFAHAGDCDHWIYIPTSAIQTIRRSGRVACAGHSHATAELQLKTPQSDLEKTFASVASLHQNKLFQPRGNMQLANLASAGCPDGYHWGQDQWGNWGCWPGP